MVFLGYFLIRNFFFPDSKIFSSTRSVLPVHTHPMVSGVLSIMPKIMPVSVGIQMALKVRFVVF